MTEGGKREAREGRTGREDRPAWRGRRRTQQKRRGIKEGSDQYGVDVMRGSWGRRDQCIELGVTSRGEGVRRGRRGGGEGRKWAIPITVVAVMVVMGNVVMVIVVTAYPLYYNVIEVHK
jgi:hypothetical protein